MCEHKNTIFIKHRLEGEAGRDYIESLSNEDKLYGINSMGTLAQKNAYGEICCKCLDCNKIYPVICMHGGSMWLCRECANKMEVF